MNITLFGKGARGTACLKMLCELGRNVSLLVVHDDEMRDGSPLIDLARTMRVPIAAPIDPNEAKFVSALAAHKPDLMILAGYGRILKEPLIAVPRIMCINLHGGKVPEYRGSSPMNWALINGDKTFTLSIIKVDSGVDKGDCLAERTFPVGENDTIRDLHAIAENQFPQMLAELLEQIETGTCRPRPQSEARAAYYPLRFPEDGFIVWDMLTAEQIHNRIRALTEPYPCATTAFAGREVKLISSKMSDARFHGEPGRVYRNSGKGLLIGASDRCLWITRAVFTDSGGPLADVMERYERLPTMCEFVRQASETHAWSSVP